MIKDIRHTGIVVQDLKASINFYKNLLGFKVAKKKLEKSEYIDKILGFKKINVTTVKMSSPKGHMIELLKYYSHPTKKKKKRILDIGISHIAFTVSNLENEYKKLTKKGFKFISKPEISPDGYAKVAFCKAPEGTFIELVEVL